jgi:hypothetical protein
MPSKKAIDAQAKVGRGNPPKHTQFKKGTTGNPKGRPKGSKNLATIIMEAARDTVAATVDGKQRKISKLQATAMQLATKGASGNHAAMAKFLDLYDEMESRAAAARPAQFPISAPDLDVLRAVYERMMQCDPKRSRN